MLKVCIIDDEVSARKTLKSLIRKNHLPLEIVGEAHSVASGLRCLNNLDPDLLFLDIRLNDGTGFDLLDKIKDSSCRIIFTTAYDEFALRAFKYNAVDYLIKPIDPDELIEAINRLHQEIKSVNYAEKLVHLLDLVKTKPFKKISLNTTKGLVFLNLEEIIRLESSGNYSIFHTLNGQKIMVSKTLKEFDNLLPEHQFFRVHQSHIINLFYIKEIVREDGGYALTHDQAKIPIARRKKDEFIATLKRSSLQ